MYKQISSTRYDPLFSFSSLVHLECNPNSEDHMPVDLTTAQAMLDKWLEAEAAVAINQAYEVAGTKVTRANLDLISQRIDYWRAQVSRFENGGDGSIRCRRSVPVDD